MAIPSSGGERRHDLDHLLSSRLDQDPFSSSASASASARSSPDLLASYPSPASVCARPGSKKRRRSFGRHYHHQHHHQDDAAEERRKWESWSCPRGAPISPPMSNYDPMPATEASSNRPDESDDRRDSPRQHHQYQYHQQQQQQQQQHQQQHQHQQQQPGYQPPGSAAGWEPRPLSVHSSAMGTAPSVAAAAANVPQQQLPSLSSLFRTGFSSSSGLTPTSGRSAGMACSPLSDRSGLHTPIAERSWSAGTSATSGSYFPPIMESPATPVAHQPAQPQHRPQDQQDQKQQQQPPRPPTPRAGHGLYQPRSEDEGPQGGNRLPSLTRGYPAETFSTHRMMAGQQRQQPQAQQHQHQHQQATSASPAARKWQGNLPSLFQEEQQQGRTGLAQESREQQQQQQQYHDGVDRWGRLARPIEFGGSATLGGGDAKEGRTPYSGSARTSTTSTTTTATTTTTSASMVGSFHSDPRLSPLHRSLSTVPMNSSTSATTASLEGTSGALGRPGSEGGVIPSAAVGGGGGAGGAGAGIGQAASGRSSPLPPGLLPAGIILPPEGMPTKDQLGPKIWTGTHFLPRFVMKAELPGEGQCFFYDDGSHCRTVIDGEAVNAHWGVTKAGKPRKRLAIACVTCREKKIKCDPDYPRCLQCGKFGRVCRFKNAPRGGHMGNLPGTSSSAESDGNTRRVSSSAIGSNGIHNTGTSPAGLLRPMPSMPDLSARPRSHSIESLSPRSSFRRHSPDPETGSVSKRPRMEYEPRGEQPAQHHHGFVFDPQQLQHPQPQRLDFSRHVQPPPHLASQQLPTQPHQSYQSLAAWPSSPQPRGGLVPISGSNPSLPPPPMAIPPMSTMESRAPGMEDMPNHPIEAVPRRTDEARSTPGSAAPPAFPWRSEAAAPSSAPEMPPQAQRNIMRPW